MQTHGECHVSAEAETGGHVATGRGMPRTDPEPGRGGEASCPDLRGHPELRLLALRAGRQSIPVVLSRPACGIGFRQPREAHPSLRSVYCSPNLISPKKLQTLDLPQSSTRGGMCHHVPQRGSRPWSSVSSSPTSNQATSSKVASAKTQAGLHPPLRPYCYPSPGQGHGGLPPPLSIHRPQGGTFMK